MNQSGKFIISLDFELLWGVRDLHTVDSYGKNIEAVWQTLPKTLQTFEDYGIQATFATVGFLFAKDYDELLHFVPNKKPNYLNKNLSPYNGHIKQLKSNSDLDKYHFATDLIELIKKYPNQELASHTHSHYYCLENGQTKEDFYEDIKMAVAIAKEQDVELNSLVFPRNQFNDEYLKIIEQLGFTSYRGNENTWFYSASKFNQGNLGKRLMRLLDSYFNISGHNCYELNDIARKQPYNIPSSRFLRPYHPKLKHLETLRLNRILNSMEYAASQNKVYHLWWHPHNFGANENENFSFLIKILKKFQELQSVYKFESITMKGLSERLNSD